MIIRVGSAVFFLTTADTTSRSLDFSETHVLRLIHLPTELQRGISLSSKCPWTVLPHIPQHLQQTLILVRLPTEPQRWYIIAVQSLSSKGVRTQFLLCSGLLALHILDSHGASAEMSLSSNHTLTNLTNLSSLLHSSACSSLSTAPS